MSLASLPHNSYMGCTPGAAAVSGAEGEGEKSTVPNLRPSSLHVQEAAGLEGEGETRGCASELAALWVWRRSPGSIHGAALRGCQRRCAWMLRAAKPQCWALLCLLCSAPWQPLELLSSGWKDSDSGHSSMLTSGDYLTALNSLPIPSVSLPP